MSLMRSIAVAAALVIAASAAEPHELWIAPQSYAVEADGRIIADIRVGENFAGAPRPYLPFMVARFEVEVAGETQPVTGRMGDMPALSMDAFASGLATVVFQSQGTEVEYLDLEMFGTFLESKGLEAFLDEHSARGLPEKNFFEVYRRFSKCLMAVGDGIGADHEIGLETEIVAEANPFADDLSAGMPVQVLYQGVPRADVQIDLFSKVPGGEATKMHLRTDSEGKVVLPVVAGGEYLVNSVVMRPAPASDEPSAPVWETLWASLTFAVPDGSD